LFDLQLPTIASATVAVGHGSLYHFQLDTPRSGHELLFTASTSVGDVSAIIGRRMQRLDTGRCGGGTPLDPYTAAMPIPVACSIGVAHNHDQSRGRPGFCGGVGPRQCCRPAAHHAPAAAGAYYAGRTAQFAAKAAGGTNLVYQWKKDGTNLSKRHQILGVLTDTLSISNVPRASFGAYSFS